MAVLQRTLTAFNLHAYSVELEKLIGEGWRVNKSVIARRSLGNKFTAQLEKGEVDGLEVKIAEIAEVEAEIAEIAEVETKAEAETPVKATRAKVTKKANAE